MRKTREREGEQERGGEEREAGERWVASVHLLCLQMFVLVACFADHKPQPLTLYIWRED